MVILSAPVCSGAELCNIMPRDISNILWWTRHESHCISKSQRSKNQKLVPPLPHVGILN